MSTLCQTVKLQVLILVFLDQTNWMITARTNYSSQSVFFVCCPKRTKYVKYNYKD